MANNNWILNYSANYSTASGWSLAHVPTTGEVAIFSNTFGSGSCTFDQNIVCSGITISGSYTGNQSASGFAYYLDDSYIDDGTGTRHLGSGMLINGANGQLHIGTTVGTITAASCVVTMNTITGGVIDIDKVGVSILSLTIGSGCVVTNSGANTTQIFNSPGSAITIGNNGRLTISRRIDCYHNNSNYVFSLGSGYIIDGNGLLSVLTNSANTNIPPLVRISGVGGFQLQQNSTGSTVNLSGEINVGSGNIDIFTSSATFAITLNTNNYNISCTALSLGSSASGIFTANLGSSTINCASYGAVSYNNNAIINLQSSIINCSGNFTYGSNWNVNPGTSLVTFNGSSPSITPNGNSFYDVLINITGTASWLAGPISLHTLTVTSGGNDWSGRVMTSSGNINIDGAGSVNAGTGITMTNPSGIIHFGSTLGGVTATSCDLIMNTTTSGVIDDDKGITFKSLTLGSGVIVTSTGAQTTTFAAGSNLTPITLGANSTLTNNSLFVASLTGSPTIISLGSGYTLNGNKRIQFAHTGNGTVTVPAITSLTWIEFLVSSTGITTIDFNGIVNMPNAALNIVQISTGTTTWNTNNYAITCSTFRSGGHSGGGVFIGNFGSSIINLATYIAYSNNINATYNFQSSTWNCSSIWNYGSLHTINPGSSIVNILPTTNTNIFSSGKAFATLNFSGSNPNVTGFFADQPILSGNLGVYGGISVNTSGLNIPITSGCYITTSGNFTSSGVYTIGKDLTFGSGTILNNSGMILNLSGQAHTITTGGRNFPYTKVYDNSTWLGSGTISRLSLYAPTVSTTHTWEAGKVYRFTSYTANDWSGTDYSHQVLFRSSANGFQTIFYAPSNTITKFTNYADINNLGSEIDASDGSSTNGGNNYGINFGVGVVHPRRPHDKNDVDFFIITKTFRW